MSTSADVKAFKVVTKNAILPCNEESKSPTIHQNYGINEQRANRRKNIADHFGPTKVAQGQNLPQNNPLTTIPPKGETRINFQ